MENIGRPTVMTTETIAKLEEGFMLGFTDKEACLFAGIAPTTLYDFCQANKEFAERKELLKEQIKMRAKHNIAKAINEGEKPLSQWYLERRDRDFKTKTDITSDEKPLVITGIQIIQETNENPIQNEKSETN